MFLTISSQCCKIKEGLERKEHLSICFIHIYTRTCTAKKYPSYGIFTNPVLLLIIALAFYCLKYIYTNFVNKLVHACKIVSVSSLHWL